MNQKIFSKVESILVLSGNEDINGTNVTNKLTLGGASERIISSIKLALENSNAIIYFLGGDGHLSKNLIDETDVAKLFYNDVGFDISRVKFIPNSRNTIENFKTFKKFYNSKKVNILITSAYHMKRSMMIANSLDLNLIPYAVDFNSIGSSKIINFYQNFNITGNLSSFNLFFREMVGIIVFRIFH